MRKNYFWGLNLVVTVATIMTLIWSSMSLPVTGQPVNDDFDDATIITELPFFDSINTTDATTAFDDPDCFGQGPTVWYSFTPESNLPVEGNTFGSDYDTHLSVYVGTRGDLTQIACNDDDGSLQSRVLFEAVAGETYYFMVGAFASGPGGNLSFTVQEAPPPPPPLVVDLTIDTKGAFDRSGTATIRGTVTCSRAAFVDLFGELQQQAGRFTIQGFFSTFFPCDGETPWEVAVSSSGGKFAGGHAQASINAFAFDQFDFTFDSKSVTVLLQGGPSGISGITIPVSPSGDLNGITDANNIESALASAGAGNIVQLEAGEYFINRTISAPFGFNGTLKGSGSELTVIQGVGSMEAPFGNAFIHNPGNPFPNFGGQFFYFPEPSVSLEVSHLSMVLPEGFFTQESDMFGQNLVAFLGVTLGLEPANTTFRNLSLRGTAAVPESPPFLISQPWWGVAVMGDRDPSDFPIPSYPGGIHQITDSKLSHIGLQATNYEVMKEAKIMSTRNQFSDIKQTIYRYVEGSDIQITRNDLDAFSFGSIVVTQENFPLPGDANKVEISHNNIVTRGFMGIEIGFLPDPNGAAFDLLIANNSITKGSDPIQFFPNLTGIGLAPGNRDAVIQSNMIKGDSQFGILLDGFDRGGIPYGVDNSMLQANNLQGFTPVTADYALIFSSDNTIIAKGSSTVLEFGGTGNIITGLQKVPGETVGNRMKEARDNAREGLGIFTPDYAN